MVITDNADAITNIVSYIDAYSAATSIRPPILEFSKQVVAFITTDSNIRITLGPRFVKNNYIVLTNVRNKVTIFQLTLGESIYIPGDDTKISLRNVLVLATYGTPINIKSVIANPCIFSIALSLMHLWY